MCQAYIPPPPSSPVDVVKKTKGLYQGMGSSIHQCVLNTNNVIPIHLPSVAVITNLPIAFYGGGNSDRLTADATLIFLEES